MERKIGEIFEYNGEWYQCIGNPYNECTDCDFCFETGKACVRQIVGQCSMSNRSDGLSVVFKKLEKVGEPYVAYGKVRQKYKLYIPLTITKGIIERDISCDDVHEIVDIANKQNKEDMEDLDKIKVRDYTKVEELNVMEENKLNLKPFDIQKAREGKPVCTRDGHKARIICFDYNGETGDYPIVALVHYNKGNKCYERVLKYTSDGLFNKYGDCQHDDDLMMLPEKKEGWINIIKTEDGGYCYNGEVHSDYNNAFIENINVLDNRGITVKIEWEE